ncbi:DUF445 family protein [Paenibacillus popilliae]|uniref:DUF445 family protein n=1 Tax=Paenibacillus popilliae TaxID=78057 RepID=A0ABY3AR10_PAEPP|nr:DUF445 family protein [Paenibacillus sp. SDF0028]TQR45090.1 DUF445 family protein [Paenibacillus sp. SDF0028]
MPVWLFISFSVVVAAIVGGVTNHFAIKMLFHPRKAMYIGRWRIPFTPGLIPKRREDIAASFGDVVAEYLVTSDGLRTMLNRPDTREKATETVLRMTQNWSEDDRTVKEWAVKLFPDKEWDEIRDQSAHRLQEWTANGVKKWLEGKGWDERPLVEWLPEGWEQSSAKWADKAAAVMLTSFEKELTSLQGQLLMTKLAKDVIDRASGFFGAMAAIFVDEDKLVTKMMPVLVEQLRSPKVRATVAGFILSKLGEWLQETPAQIVRSWTDIPEETNSLDFIVSQAAAMIQWPKRIDRLGEIQPAHLVGKYKAVWSGYIPRAVEAAFALLDRNLDAIVRAARLQEVVRTQVEQFPIERLETIILSVSGKEFRAITWLGALLGGIIGLVQAFVLLAVG